MCVLVCPGTKKYITAAGGNYSFPAVDIASKGELEEILQLQKLAYQSEGELYNDFNIPPLVQSLEELEEEAGNSIVLKVVEDRKIVGSVRAYEEAGSCYISKLIVHPDYQNRGIGKKLISAVENCFEHVRYELFTGHLSRKNLSLYRKMGYKEYRTRKISDNLELIYLEKQN